MENWKAQIEKQIKLHHAAIDLIETIDKSETIPETVSQDPEERAYYRKSIEDYMSHNQEKNRDRQGKEFYARLTEYLGKLNI